jgi:hypothetical protein
VVIDEQTTTASSGPLYLGTHRVWVEAADGSAAAERHNIELGTSGVTEVVNYPAESDEGCEIAAPAPVVAPPAPPPPILMFESGSCTELALLVQHVLIFPSGLLDKCSHGNAQNVGDILSVILIPFF